MGLKLFCAKCGGEMRALLPSEATRLTGDEICSVCEAIARETLKKFESLYKKLSGELARKHNDGVVKLEALIRDVFK